MIEKEGLIYRTQGKRTLLLRESSHERIYSNQAPANYNGTGLALVAITRKYESPDSLINRINGMSTHFRREADSAFALHNQVRNAMYKQQKELRNGSKSE